MVSNFNVCEDVVTRDKGSLSFFVLSCRKREKQKNKTQTKPMERYTKRVYREIRKEKEVRLFDRG